MKRLLVIFAVLLVSLLLANHAQAGTLDRGVHIGAFFIAGGTNGDAMTSQLKYQMAIDTFIGFENRYTTIMYTYSYTTNYNDNNGTFNTFNVDVSNSGDSTANVEINTN